MKLYQIINAFKTLEQLSDNEHLTDKDQWNIYKLRNHLKTHVDFEKEREEAIRQKFLPLANEEGRLSPSDTAKYANELNDLANMDVDVEEFKKPEIKFVKGITCKITDPLEGFVEFLPPDE